MLTLTVKFHLKEPTVINAAGDLEADVGAAVSSSGHVGPQQVPQLQQLPSTASYVLANRGLALVPAVQMSHHFLQHMCPALRDFLS